MSQISQASTANFTSQEASGQTGGATDSFTDIDIDEFLALMIAELQNQDPLDPMDNSEMVQQIGQIRGNRRDRPANRHAVQPGF